MQEPETYNVVLSGKIKSGFEPELVIEALAQLFKMPPEKAEKLVGAEFVIKKEIDLKVAKKYQDKLSAIGMEVALQRNGVADALALEPIESNVETPAEAVADASTAAAVDADPVAAAPSVPNGMVCPKCNREQPKADQCSACGVFVQKVLAAQAATAAAPAESTTVGAAASEFTLEESPSAPWQYFAIPAAVALVGAFIWYLLAISTQREFGVIAWAIGGAVGFTALISGARGHATGVVCGILVLVSIFGGKFMTQSAFLTEYAEMVKNSKVVEGIDLEALYQVEVADAQEYAQLDGGELELRQFMVDHGYSDAGAAADVTAAEIDEFETFYQSRLESIAADRLNFDDWRRVALSESIENYSTLDLVVESLGLMDILFLIFGIGTAYNLASRGRG